MDHVLKLVKKGLNTEPIFALGPHCAAQRPSKADIW
jgi:hypothetical protein